MKRFLACLAAVVILAGWTGAVESAAAGEEMRLVVRLQSAGTEAPATEPKPAAEKAPAKAEPSQPAFEKPGPAPAATGFAFKDTAGQYIDVYLDGRAVARYMYASDTSTPEKADETYKPYLHVLNAEGTAPITKGPGGFYTHHRGIFFGWQKVGFDGKKYNLWEMGGDNRQVHLKFLAQTAEADRATFTSQVAWNLADGKTIIEESRTFTFHRCPAPALALIDFSATVKAVAGDLTLDGDPEHGGVQYRPADEVDRKATEYCLPKDAVEPPLDPNAEFQVMAETKEGKTAAITKIAKTDLPWAAESYVLGGKTYYVQEMSHPDNPKGTLWSAYRDYGRFGAFPGAELKNGETLTVRYRFWVSAGPAPSREELQKQWDAYAKAPAAGAAQ
jgi:hypothetical protein